jgi:hypothetical protein
MWPKRELVVKDNEATDLDRQGLLLDCVNLDEPLVEDEDFDPGDFDSEVPESFEDMTVAELKNELRSRGLHVGGDKDELQARLGEALAGEGNGSDPADNDDEEGE